MARYQGSGYDLSYHRGEWVVRWWNANDTISVHKFGNRIAAVEWLDAQLALHDDRTEAPAPLTPADGVILDTK